MKRLEFQIDPEHEGNTRIDVLLTGKLDGFSRNAIQKLINDGAVLLDNKPVKMGYHPKAGEKVQVAIPAPVTAEILAEDLPLNIIYEDDVLIVVNKPQGMVVHPAAGHESGTLVNALMYCCGEKLSGINGEIRPGIVHRLDKDTSGILVAAKNDSSHKALAAQLSAHTVTRVYLAVVHGRLKNDIGTVDKPIGRHPADRKKMAVNIKNGRAAVTHYRVLEYFKAATLVECRLETGRTHQIRVHMSYIGHPLLGDPVYGGANNPYKLTGQALHARLIGFKHPTTDEYVQFEAAPPAYFNELIKKL